MIVGTIVANEKQIKWRTPRKIETQIAGTTHYFLRLCIYTSVFRLFYNDGQQPKKYTHIADLKF